MIKIALEGTGEEVADIIAAIQMKCASVQLVVSHANKKFDREFLEKYEEMFKRRDAEMCESCVLRTGRIFGCRLYGE